LAAVVVLTLVVHAVGLASYKLLRPSPPEPPKPPPVEIALGRFTFSSERGEVGTVAQADFDLHVTLIPETEQKARGLLETHRYRVQQQIEQLLRRAHPADFESPSLAGLKRQVQEQLNEALGVRAVAEVIVTRLRTTSSDRPAASSGAVAEAAPTRP
jgi:flagellar basal body-associated protein FliL